MIQPLLVNARDHYNFLGEVLASPEWGRGAKTKLAKVLNCRSAFISQVIAGRNSLTLEMAHLAAKFLELNTDEVRFLLLLVQRDRSGNHHLRSWFDRELAALREEHRRVKNRVTGKGLVGEAADTYYSQWWYAAIHVLTGLKEFQTAHAISERLHLPLRTVNDTLHFLVEHDLVSNTPQNGFKIGNARIHLADDSPKVSVHHTNWRLKMSSTPPDHNFRPLRYTGVLAFSQADAERIRGLILDAIKDCEDVLQNTQEEDAFLLQMEFARI